jgi:hypothetical protein
MSFQRRERIAVVKSVTPLEKGAEVSLHDFQICSSNDKGEMFLVDFDMKDHSSRDTGYEIRPGIWRITPQDGLQHLDVPPVQYFETDTSVELLNHMNLFVNKQDVYKRLKIPTRRGILLSSSPGQGKSSLIKYFVQSLKARTDVCTLMIDNQDVSWEKITRMFAAGAPGEDVSLIVLVIEDIGGSELDQRARRVESDMLNFLEGADDCYKIPTLIVGTTNFINELGARLVDRPGRFDMVIDVQPPKDKDIRLIVEGLKGRPITDEESASLFGKGFTPAYCKEIVIRSELYDMSIMAAAEELEKQRKKARDQTHGEKDKTRVGFSLDDDDQF